MVESLGAKVLKLVRTKIGTIEIGDLEIGKYRELTTKEVAALGGGISGSRTRSGHPARSFSSAGTKRG